MVQFQQLDRVVKAASRRLKHAVAGIAVALVGLAVWLFTFGLPLPVAPQRPPEPRNNGLLA